MIFTASVVIIKITIYNYRKILRLNNLAVRERENMNQIKILHCADLHLGAELSSIGTHAESIFKTAYSLQNDILKANNLITE